MEHLAEMVTMVPREPLDPRVEMDLAVPEDCLDRTERTENPVPVETGDQLDDPETTVLTEPLDPPEERETPVHLVCLVSKDDPVLPESERREMLVCPETSFNSPEPPERRVTLEPPDETVCPEPLEPRETEVHLDEMVSEESPAELVSLESLVLTDKLELTDDLAVRELPDVMAKRETEVPQVPPDNKEKGDNPEAPELRETPSEEWTERRELLDDLVSLDDPEKKVTLESPDELVLVVHLD